jgi:hypothetical protein
MRELKTGPYEMRPLSEYKITRKVSCRELFKNCATIRITIDTTSGLRNASVTISYEDLKPVKK